VAARAIGLTVGWAFAELGLERVHGLTETDNGAAQRAMASAGLLREGVWRDCYGGDLGSEAKPAHGLRGEPGAALKAVGGTRGRDPVPPTLRLTEPGVEEPYLRCSGRDGEPGRVRCFQIDTTGAPCQRVPGGSSSPRSTTERPPT
jgi:hypothetical protein